MIDKKTKESLADKHILCFGVSPEFLIQTPLRVEWFGAYSSLHGSSRLTSAISAYMFASVSQNKERVIRIISNHYPAINISLDKVTSDFEKGSSQGLIYQLLNQTQLHLKNGLNIFIESETKHGFHFGSSSGFLLIVLEAIAFVSKSKSAFRNEEKIRLIHHVEQNQMITPCHLSDALSMLEGGTNLYQMDGQNYPIYQKSLGSFKAYKIIALSIQNFVHQAHLGIKNILEQMNIIAQHYQQKHLMDIDSLTFHHDERDLSLLFGTKAIAKANHFFQENFALKKAFLALEKDDEKTFFNLLMQTQQRDVELLEHHQVSSPSELKIANTIKWLHTTFPNIAFRLHGFGFQGDFILLIPNESYRETFQRLKKQFYQDHVKEIKIVNQGIRIFKL
jgi:galactokinase